MPAGHTRRFEDAAAFVDIAANYGFYWDVVKGDVTETEIEALCWEGQFSLPIDFDEMRLRPVGEALPAAAHHLARNIHAKNLLEMPRQRLQKPSCSAADLQGAVMCFENLSDAFQRVFGCYQGSPQYMIQREYYEPTVAMGFRWTHLREK